MVLPPALRAAHLALLQAQPKLTNEAQGIQLPFGRVLNSQLNQTSLSSQPAPLTYTVTRLPVYLPLASAGNIQTPQSTTEKRTSRSRSKTASTSNHTNKPALGRM